MYARCTQKLRDRRPSAAQAPPSHSPTTGLANQTLLAGGIGGCVGDLLIHSLDTVKTRQQGDRSTPRRYTSIGHAYRTILRQEGVVRGLYGGASAAALGSFPSTLLFFGGYEWSKRHLLEAGVKPHVAYLLGGE